MAKPPKQQDDKRPASASAARKQGGEEQATQPEHQDGTRETVESIIVAFILAFLFRTFEAEAFVIPTGSMAPTLYGRHINYTCPQCGLEATVGASSEIDKDSGYYEPRDRIARVICPNCRHENEIFDRDEPDERGLPVFRGDRILVNKFPYEFFEPKRWDVVVFKFPENPNTNYIKRLAGLPGEELRIERGDLYVRSDSDEPFRIARKQDPDKQRELQVLVYDNDHPAPKLHDWGWPERWAPLRRRRDPGGDRTWVNDTDGWTADYEARTFELADEDGTDYRWLRYRHVVPTPEDWNDLEHGVPLTREPRPRLITDFYGYNAYVSVTGETPFPEDIYWVGDLTLSCHVEIRRAEGELLLELVKGGYRYRCRIDLSTGRATLFFIDEVFEKEPPREEHVLATAETGIDEAGGYELAFANVDRRLCLWVDGDLIPLGSGAEYDRPALPAPQDDDLRPVGIAARGASVRVSSLSLERDVYYRADAFGEQQEFAGAHAYLRSRLDDPAAWFAAYEENRKVARFQLGPGEYFMLGDNSPHSSDSRLWPKSRPRSHPRYAVPRSALVGKAFYIYWPHGIPFMNDGRGYAMSVPPLKRFFYHKVGPGRYPENLRPPREPYPKFRVPFYPNVGRMHRIR